MVMLFIMKSSHVTQQLNKSRYKFMWLLFFSHGYQTTTSALTIIHLTQIKPWQKRRNCHGTRSAGISNTLVIRDTLRAENIEGAIFKNKFKLLSTNYSGFRLIGTRRDYNTLFQLGGCPNYAKLHLKS
jgi:hypothetical protein